MQRQFCIKLLSKTPQNPLKNNPSLHQQLFSQKYATFSHSNFTKLYTPNNNNNINHGISGAFRNGFFFSSSIFARRFSLLSGNGKLRVSSKEIRVWAKRKFHSFDSHKRGWRSYFRNLTTDGVVKGLILTNVGVFMLWRVAGHQFMVNNFMVSLDNFTSGRLHTLVTCAFSHRDMWHLISNMVGLYFFGTSIGGSFGPQYLLGLYLSGAVVGSIFYLGYNALVAQSVRRNQTFGIDPSRIPGQGASGAVNAIMLLDIFLYPKKTILLDFFIPVPAILLGIFIVGKDVLRILEGNDQISGSAHFGGAVVAAAAWARTKKGRFPRF